VLKDEEQSPKIPLRTPISKNNPLTMASLYKIHTSSNPSEKGKIVKADRNTLHRIVTAFKAGREVNMSEILYIRPLVSTFFNKISNSNDLFLDLRDPLVSAIAIGTGISSCLSISDMLTSLPALKVTNESEHLLSIATKDKATDVIKESPLNARKIGQKQLEYFVKDRFVLKNEEQSPKIYVMYSCQP
jgi:hypothetical protein